MQGSIHFAVIVIVGFGSHFSPYFGVEGNVKIHSYKHRNAITKCDNGILANYDRINFSGKIHFRGHWNFSRTNLLLQIKEPNGQFETVYHHTFYDCLHLGDLPIQCSITENKQSFNFSISLLAKANYSNGKLKIKLTTENISFESNVIPMPNIFDSTKYAIYVNGYKIQSHISIINIDQIYPILMMCCDQFSPNTTLATIKLMGRVVASAERCASYFPNLPEEIQNYDFICNICNSEIQSASCSVKQGQDTVVERVTTVLGNGNLETKDSGCDKTGQLILNIINIVGLLFMAIAAVVYLIARRINARYDNCKQALLKSAKEDMCGDDPNVYIPKERKETEIIEI